MKVTPESSRDEILTWARHVRSLLDARGNAEQVQAIDEAIRQYESDRFLLAVVGKTKRGKSTLVNALLGRRDDALAPISKMPASSVITRFFHADQEQGKVFYRDGKQTAIRFADVKEYVTEERNPQNVKEVTAVEVGGRFPGLAQQAVLLDTPGSGSIHLHHDALLHASIPQADAVIFLVTARLPLDQDEVDLLNALKKADIHKVFFVINMVDASDEQEIQEGIAHNLRVLGSLGIEDARAFHRISARQAFEGQMAGSGVPELLEAIQGFLKTGKERLLNERFIGRIAEKLQPVRERVAVELASSHKSVMQLDQDLASLRQTKDKLKEERDWTGREFAIAWGRAVDLFAHQVSECKATIVAEVRTAIAEVPLAKLAAFTKSFPTLITQRVEEHLREPAARLESQLKQACARLEATYPTLDVDNAGAVSVRTKEGKTLVVGGMAGAALGAGGVGVVIAGSTAAAGIAAANTTATAAIAAASGFHVATFLGSALTGVASFLPGPLAAIFSSLGTGLGATAGTTSVGLLATPAWIALAGPIGWTLSGLGVLTIPIAWRFSRIKQKEKLEEAAVEEINRIMAHLQTERIPMLRQMALSILDEFHTKLDRQLSGLEATLVRSLENRPSPEKVRALEAFSGSLSEVMQADNTAGSEAA